MTSSMSVADLEEELLVQNVIMDSLAGETFPGAERERREATAELVRLNRLLESARSRDTGRQDESHHASSSQRGGAAPLASPLANTFHSSPNRAHRSSPGMATPSRAADIWSNPGSASLPSRKREFSSTNLLAGEGLSKSRRTTPTPGSSSFAPPPQQSPSNMSQFDIIDLTGEDVDQDSTWVAEHIKREKRFAQERDDRNMALTLSSQEAPPSSASAQRQANPAHTGAFAKLMATQQANARTPGGANSSPSSNHAPRDDNIGWSTSSPSVRAMPGDFDASRDNQFGPSQGFRMPQGVHPRHVVPSTPQPAFPVSTYPGSPAPLSAPPNGQYTMPGTFPGQYQVPNGFPTLGGYHSQLTTAAGSSGLNPMARFNAGQGPGMPGHPNMEGGSMSNLINRTSMFSYPQNGQQFDQPMSDRLNSYLQEAYHDPRVTEQELDDLLQNIRPDMDIPERNRDGTPAGLKSSLYPHQELALTWMKKMEEGTNKGGILADDMGLGKTISTLALMLARPSTSRPKTNLIIGPLSLIRQWEEEITKKTKLSHRMSVFVYHGKKATTEDMLKYDVVLTTYGTIASELKRVDKFEEENKGRAIDYNDKAISTKFPLLHPRKAMFYRVILDEAQCIKNKETKTAKACHKLRSTYRWCLTGTPMMNGVLELYSLVHFLKIKPYSVWERFRGTFGMLFGRNGDPKHVAMGRLRALLKAIMLRRKKDSLLDGKPILKLPPKTEEIVYAELSPDEQDFYKQLEMKSQVQFSKYLRDGSIGKNYSSILVLLLRLRQACCHPHLNLDVEDVSPVSDENMSELVKSLDDSIVRRIKEMESFECPICYDAVQSPSFFIPCGHDSCQQCLSRIVDNATAMNIQEGNESDRAKCPVCRGQFEPKKCFTYEAFKSVYMPETVAKPEPEAEEFDSDDESMSDDDDDDDADSKGNLKGFIVDDDGGGDYRSRERKPKSEKKKGKKKKAEVRPSMLKSLRKEAYKNKKAYKRYMQYLRKTWMPAAKVSECMRLLKEIQDTGEKTIIFSQWTLLLDLLEVAMHHDGFPQKPRRYDGSMSGEQRNDAAVAFREKKDVTVMLVSLRAGNAGLNLTSASRVIIMDPFWNPYTEMQAVDRAYRIGQQNEVKVYRILTEETVEDRIIALQEKKKAIVEAALDEKESMKIGRLNTNELKFLFNT